MADRVVYTFRRLVSSTQGAKPKKADGGA
jgi:hypothetical protein